MGKGSRNRKNRAVTPKPVWKRPEDTEWKPSEAQRRAMHKEINQQILIRDEWYWLNFDACILWTIHKSLGKGKTALKRLFMDFNRDHQALRKFYELGDSADDAGFVARLALKEIGVDLEAWEKEVGLR